MAITPFTPPLAAAISRRLITLAIAAPPYAMITLKMMLPPLRRHYADYHHLRLFSYIICHYADIITPRHYLLPFRHAITPLRHY